MVERAGLPIPLEGGGHTHYYEGFTNRLSQSSTLVSGLHDPIERIKKSGVFNRVTINNMYLLKLFELKPYLYVHFNQGLPVYTASPSSVLKSFNYAKKL